MNQNNTNTLLEPEKELETRDNKEYKVKLFIDNGVYSKKAESQLFDLYYLVWWKNYLEKEYT